METIEAATITTEEAVELVFLGYVMTEIDNRWMWVKE